MKGLTEMTITPGKSPTSRKKIMQTLKETILHLFPGRLSTTLKRLSAALPYFISKIVQLKKKAISSTELEKSHFLLWSLKPEEAKMQFL